MYVIKLLRIISSLNGRMFEVLFWIVVKAAHNLLGAMNASSNCWQTECI